MMHEKAEDQISLLREESESLDFPLRSPTSPSRRIYGIVIHALLGIFVLTTGVVSYRYYKLLQAQPQLFCKLLHCPPHVRLTDKARHGSSGE